MKQKKRLTKEQYLKKFSRAVRWRLPPQESEEAIADYRELIFQDERDELKLVEELGDPVQAAHLLTDVKTYRQWLTVFAVLTLGLILLIRWDWMGRSATNSFFGYSNVWYPVWVMAAGLITSLAWFLRCKQKSNFSAPMSKRLLPILAVIFVYGAGTLCWNWYIMTPEILQNIADNYPTVSWPIILLRELLLVGGCGCALIALFGLILAKRYDRRWLALYTLALTVSVLCSFVLFNLHCMDLEITVRETVQTYLFVRLIPIGAVGLIGTGMALC